MRAASNCLYPPLRLSYDGFVEEYMSKKKKSMNHRYVGGDMLGGEQNRAPLSGDPLVVGCFRAISQCDHLRLPMLVSFLMVDFCPSTEPLSYLS